MKRLTTLLVSLTLFACNNSNQQTSTNPVYYDVASYVNDQIKALSAQKPATEKDALIKGQSNHQTTSNIDWAKELELFAQADINKPAFRNSYTITRPDSLSYQYTLKPTEEKLTVRSLSVRLDSASRKPVEIQAILRSENPLYSSERRLLLVSGARKEQAWGLKNYRIEGYQQLTYFDRNNFRVEGRIK
jgi:hypothetical protein